jgi:hypothetical protein
MALSREGAKIVEGSDPTTSHHYQEQDPQYPEQLRAKFGQIKDYRDEKYGINPSTYYEE